MNGAASDSLLRVFLCASDEDKRHVDQLAAHAAQLEQRGRLNLQHQGTLTPGAHVLRELVTTLERSHRAVLLLSPAFFTDRDIMAVLLPLAIARASAGHLRLSLVLLRPCMWQEHPDLAGHDILPKGGQALAALIGTRRDEAMVAIFQTLLGLNGQDDKPDLVAEDSFAQFLEEARVLERSWLTPNENVEFVRDWADPVLDVANLLLSSPVSKVRRAKNVGLKFYDRKTDQENAHRIARFVDGIEERLSGATIYHREGRRRPLSVEQVSVRLRKPLQRKHARDQLTSLMDALWKLQVYEIRRKPVRTPSVSPSPGPLPALYLSYVPADTIIAHRLASLLEERGVRCSRQELSASAGDTAFEMLRLRTHLLLLWSPNAARTPSLASKLGLAVVEAAYQGPPSVVVVLDDAELPGSLLALKHTTLRSINDGDGEALSQICRALSLSL